MPLLAAIAAAWWGQQQQQQASWAVDRLPHRTTARDVDGRGGGVHGGCGVELGRSHYGHGQRAYAKKTMGSAVPSMGNACKNVAD